MSALADLPEVTLSSGAWSQWLLTAMGKAVDQAALETAWRVIAAAATPSPTELPKLRAAAEAFIDGTLWQLPHRFFDFLQRPPDMVVPETCYRRRVRGGVVVGRRFAGRYRPFRGVPSDPHADAILVEHWMHEDRPAKGTVLALHGFTMGNPRFDAIAMFANAWFRRGLDVALLTLPYHGGRSPKGSLFSGIRFVAPNPAKFNDSVRRAVYDTYVVHGWLRERTGLPVGLMGLSLGGYISALMAGLCSDLDFVIAMVPPVCIGDLIWRILGIRRNVRPDVAEQYSREELRAVFRVHSPLTHRLRVPAERVMIVAGRGDRIVPPEHPHALWRHWGEPNIYWFGGGHLGQFDRAGMFRAAADHVARLGIIDPPRPRA